jgi:hypothetical protein
MDFVCITDDSNGIVSAVDCREFPPEISNWKAWWFKAYLFHKRNFVSTERDESHEPNRSDHNESDPVQSTILSGDVNAMSALKSETHTKNSHWIIYIDLDTVIVNNLDFLFDFVFSHNENCFYTLNPSTMANENRSEGINSSIMVWKSGKFSIFYEFLLKFYDEITACVYKFDHYLEMMFYSVYGTTTFDRKVHETISDSVTEIEQSLSRLNITTIPFDTEDHSNELNDIDLILQKILHNPLQCTGDTCSMLLTQMKLIDENFVSLIFFQDIFSGRIVEFASLCNVNNIDVNELKRSISTARRSNVSQKLESEESIYSNDAKKTSTDRHLDGNQWSGLDNAAIICFPLIPKPHEVVSRFEWIKRHWHDEK